MRLDVGSRRPRCASTLPRRVSLAWLMIPALAVVAHAQDVPLDVVNPKGHRGGVLGVAFAPDGKVLVSCGSDGLAKIWDVVKGTVRADLAGHEGKVLRVAVSPDGKTIATGGEDRTVRLWNAADGKAMGTLSGHTEAVTALAFAPEGTVLASGSQDYTIRLWDVASARALRTLKGHDSGVQDLAFAPDGKSIASAGRDATIRLWEVAVERESTILGMHRDRAWCVAFAPDGKTVVSGGLDKMVRFWPVGQPDPRPPPQNPQQPDVQLAMPKQGQSLTQPFRNDVRALAFAPDGSILAVALSDVEASGPIPGSIAIVNPAIRHALGPRWEGHLGAVRALAFAADGKTMASGGGDGSIRLWDVASGTMRSAWLGPRPALGSPERPMVHPSPVEAMAFLPDGKAVATATGSPIVTFWDVQTRELRRRLRDPSGAVHALAISPDGAILATGGDGKVVTLWDLATGRERAILKGHDGAVTCLAFAPDGKTMASGSRDASVTVWDVARAVALTTLARHTSGITCLAFAADGKMLATGSLDWTVKLWDLPSGALRHSLDGPREAIRALAFAPDGKTLAFSDRNGQVRFWDGLKVGPWGSLASEAGLVGPLVFRTASQSLFTGAADGSLRRWDVTYRLKDAIRPFEDVIRPRAHVGPLLALAVSGDGKMLASAGADCQVKLWDVSLELAPPRFGGLGSKVQSLAITRDGKFLASAAKDGSVNVSNTKNDFDRGKPIVLNGPVEVRLAFSPDSKVLAMLSVGSGKETLKFWDASTQLVDLPMGEQLADARVLAFMPVGKTLATAGGPIILVGFDGVRSIRTFRNSKGLMLAIAVSPDGSRIATARGDGVVSIWDAARGVSIATLRGETRPARHLAFAPDGKTLATGGSDGVVRLWDVNGWTERAQLPAARGMISDLAFAPDGKVLAASSEGAPTVVIWDVVRGRLAATLTLPGASAGEGIACLVFAPDGKILYTGGERGIEGWDVTPGSRILVRPADPAAGR
jgi:WD40 repeat protein